MSETFVALLRGINVGGHNKLPMKQLTAIVEGVGGLSVRTYIQSGNIVFEATGDLESRPAEAITKAILADTGIEAPVIVRTVEELREIVDANPYLRAGIEPQQLHLGFLADVPKPEDVAELDPKRSPSDAFTVLGSAIYLHLPNGVARTKLTNAYFDSRLKTTSTFRNWRTTLKLLELATE